MAAATLMLPVARLNTPLGVGSSIIAAAWMVVSALQTGIFGTTVGLVWRYGVYWAAMSMFINGWR